MITDKAQLELLHNREYGPPATAKELCRTRSTVSREVDHSPFMPLSPRIFAYAPSPTQPLPHKPIGPISPMRPIIPSHPNHR
ncbi:MAG: Helix-turn-helix domain-containing protein [Verrucomicrobia bacterium]|nr:MAG: Helix-turn-helix domain-containing protein [Verrucomicrobiota bacterium]